MHGRCICAEDILEMEAAAAAAAEARAARTAERSAHRQRQRQRQRCSRDTELLSLLHRTFAAQSASAAGLVQPAGGSGARGTCSIVSRPVEVTSRGANATVLHSDAVTAHAADSERAGGNVWLSHEAEERWSGSCVYSDWDSVQAAVELGRIDWEAVPADADPCRGGGLGFGPRGLRKRLQACGALLPVQRTTTPWRSLLCACAASLRLHSRLSTGSSLSVTLSVLLAFKPGGRWNHLQPRYEPAGIAFRCT